MSRRSTCRSSSRSTTRPSTSSRRSTRVRAAMDASEYSYEIIVVDDGSSDNSAEVASRIPGIRFLHFLQNRGSGSGAQGRHQSRVRPDHRVDRRRHDVPERHDSAAREGARRLRPGRRGPDDRRRNTQGTPGSGEVADPQTGELPDRNEDPRSQLRVPRVPNRRRAPVPQPTPDGFLVRHDDHDDVPRQRLFREVRPDRLREARRASPSSTGTRTRGGTRPRSSG